MAFLRTTLCAVFVVTVVFSKPVFLSNGEDSSKSSESTESNSSEENTTNVEPSQEPLQPLTEMPIALEQTDPTGTAAPLPSVGPSLATLNTSALPEPEDPQASTDTDALQLMPNDPSQTPLGIHMPSDPAQDPITDATNQPLVTTTYQELPKGATPPLPQQAIKPTPPPFSTAQPMPIPVDPAMTGVPVCFTFQFVTPEPKPPRGDSI